MTPDQIKKIRHDNKLSVRQFAEQIGVSWRTVQEWEQGRRRPAGPTRILIEKIFQIPA